MRNNLVVGNRDYQLAYWQADLRAADIVFDHNLVWPKELKTFANPDWAKRWVPTLGENAVVRDPKFVDPEQYNFMAKDGLGGEH